MTVGTVCDNNVRTILFLLLVCSLCKITLSNKSLYMESRFIAFPILRSKRNT